jgi:hypothetical protein
VPRPKSLRKDLPRLLANLHYVHTLTKEARFEYIKFFKECAAARRPARTRQLRTA